ncbi:MULTISPECIES: ATP-binding protein [unclassified Treponema]|uniref:ATP-binding protein n=1 Tax=unclassified Treponema TaxID=2638727 RepID=UPI0005300F39|nr:MULTISPECIES: ATP-binding protein [unclassified Treponema]AIW89242.1 ATPase AAA [Treponema sp. OMZ 838]UTC50715.1 ATP-binding protein [Treponema sp. OMZ 855]
MNTPRKLPIGIQSFEKLRRDGYLYIDKTPFLWRLVQVSSPYFLSRPRRFGKSLFLSTLAAYFRGQKELFKDLYLEKAEEEQAAQEGREAWQEYPVLYLDFNTENYNDEKSMHTILHTHLVQWEKQYESDTSEQTFSSRFKGIIQRAYQKTGKQVVILVDEYDKPLLQTMGINEALNEQYRNALKAFYSVIKTCDEYIRFAFLTGVTKFSKISIFSDLNNLRDISIEKQYASLCGITQTELETNFQPDIQVLADEQNLTYQQALAALKQWYDGYMFHPAGEGMYNPFSLLSAFVKKEISGYWFGTGTPTFLVNFLKEAHYYIPDLDGNVQLDEDGLQTYRAVAQDALPILFQAGYLTIKEYIKDLRLYRLGFPNDEVRYGFLHNLLPAYSDVPFGQTGVWVGRFVQDIRKGDVNSFMERMQAIIASIPYDDFPKNKLKLREQNYQTAVYLVFALMGQFVQTEVHCATGRADAVVITADAVYIFEFKLSGNGSAEDAFNQIKTNGYAAKYMASGKKIVLIGSSFDEQTRTIKDWKTEVLDK